MYQIFYKKKTIILTDKIEEETEGDNIDVKVEVHQELVEDDKAINKKVKDFGKCISKISLLINPS